MRKAKATQRLVPYSENKGYASNPRRFRYAQAATVPFRATETLGLAEPLWLINRDVLKHG